MSKLDPAKASYDILGAGPAGLCLAIQLRKAFPEARLRLYEQNAAAATFGFGVVFSDGALDFLGRDDPELLELVSPRMERWQDMMLDHPDGQVVIDGIGFAAIGRLTLLELLQARASQLDIAIDWQTRLDDLGQLDADVIIGADGIHSLVRQSDPDGFASETGQFSNYFAWFGTRHPFDQLTQTFRQFDHNGRKVSLNAHHYRYHASESTFIVETDPASFAALGLDQMDEQASADICAGIFAETLKGQPLLINKSHWRQFPRLWCGQWVNGRRVVIGDAAHAAHFSIGSGTRLAFEDGIALAAALKASDDLDEGLAAFQASRPPVAAKIIEAANRSASWYDQFSQHLQLDPLAFAAAYITRSGRVDRKRLAQISPKFAAQIDFLDDWQQTGKA